MPDLHARADFLEAVLDWRPPAFGAGPAALKNRPALAELLAAGEAQLVCLGDIFHTEVGSAGRRWAEAFAEYASNWAAHRAMDEEMGLCLSAASLVLETKLAYPKQFHCLKGNHDNIADEEGRGDHPFYKFAAEGEMVASWFEARYGRELLGAYREFELGLPVLALGDRFIASHAEPARALGREEIVEYRGHPDLVEALIWTANGEAEEGFCGAEHDGPPPRRLRLRRSPLVRGASSRRGSLLPFARVAFSCNSTTPARAASPTSCLAVRPIPYATFSTFRPVTNEHSSG